MEKVEEKAGPMGALIDAPVSDLVEVNAIPLNDDNITAGWKVENEHLPFDN